MNDFYTKLESAYKSKLAPKRYSEVRIYHGGKDYDLSKRWYVYYEFLNPETNKMTRQPPITMGCNRDHKNKKDRFNCLMEVQEALEGMLKDGGSPYDNNPPFKSFGALSLLESALEMKRNTISEGTFYGYKTLLNGFKKYLVRKDLNNRPIEAIDKKVVNDFLNEKLRETSAPTRNSYRTLISILFQQLEDQDYIQRNFILNIKPLKTKPERNKSYSLKQASDLINYIEKTDETMTLLIKFVSYNFLRPIEVCRL